MEAVRQLTSEERIQKDIRRTHVIGWVVVLVFGLALAILIGSVAVSSWQYEQRHTFRSAAWMTGGERVHGDMIDDLLETYDLIGMSRSEVTALLGAGIKQSVYASDDAFVYRVQIRSDVQYLVLTMTDDVVTAVDLL